MRDRIMKIGRDLEVQNMFTREGKENKEAKIRDK